MAAQSANIIRRSLLYVPASSEKMLAKSLHIKSDNITYDLEDSVALHKKFDARSLLTTHLASFHPVAGRPAAWKTNTELCVRINAVSTPFALADLTSLASSPSLDAVLIPKVNSAADLSFVTDVLRHIAPERHTQNSPNPIKIIALIESARAIMNLSEICSASPFLSGLVFAAEDFALDLSITRTPSLAEFLYARSAIVTAARAFNLPSAIDLVCTSYRGEEDLDRLKEECINGRNMGFNGKQCIHPTQVGPVQQLFAPSQADLIWSARISIANEKAEAQGRGAWTLDGKMIDAPVVNKARSVLERGVKCELDVASIMNSWKDQSPE
ncbi:Citrate lyase subunit beta [Ceratocystis lukuohia]|uniref:Citrate lyase subunit beta n=1 Tax=Ceratocystis lukuohia TaxID=2019550 RepID=A0ABR4MPA0_9PEZI